MTDTPKAGVWGGGLPFEAEINHSSPWADELSGEHRSPDHREEDEVEQPVELEEVEKFHPSERHVLHFEHVSIFLDVAVDVHFARIDPLHRQRRGGVGVRKHRDTLSSRA